MEINLDKIKSAHFIGIGGIGISASSKLSALPYSFSIIAFIIILIVQLVTI